MLAGLRWLLDSPVREWRLRTACHRYDHCAEAYREDRRGGKAGKTQHAAAPTRRIRENRTRFHDGSVLTSAFPASENG